MQPRTPESEIRRAGEAEQILNSEVFKDAFKQVEEALLNGMKSAAIVDDKMRLRLLDNYQSLQAILQCLRSTMETGILAKQQLEIEKKKSVFQMVRDKFG
jgi:hypothetical protein